jgi:hypothetical protein
MTGKIKFTKSMREMEGWSLHLPIYSKNSTRASILVGLVIQPKEANSPSAAKDVPIGQKTKRKIRKKSTKAHIIDYSFFFISIFFQYFFLVKNK